MKIKAVALGLLVASSLVACQADEEPGNGNNNEGAQNTSFERMADDMNNQGNNNNANREDDNRMENKDDNHMGTSNDNKNGANQHEYDVAEKAAQNIEKNVKGINEAYVLTTNDNAYVAAVLDNQNGQAKEEVSNKVEQQITKIVKEADQGINNVYISTNPDFVDLTNNYVNDVGNGEPIQGFFREFGRMTDRLFPDAQS